MCVNDFVSISTFARIIDFGIVRTMWYILFGIILQDNKSSQLFFLSKKNCFINYTNRQNVCMLRRAIRHTGVII